jgi:serine/threonine-protein kinase
MGDETLKSGENLVKLGVIDAAKLQQAQSRLDELRQSGKMLKLADVVVQLGYGTRDAVARAILHEGTAVFRCPTCKRRYTVPEFQSPRRYRCSPCKAYLELVLDGIFTPDEGAAAPVRRDKFQDRIFGKYKILRPIAKGGMGAVYLGEHVELGKKVAIKILTEEYSKMPGIQGRFKREATAGGRLEHPNIVTVLDMDQADGYAYIVTEFVDGPSLEQLIQKEKQFTPERAIDIVSGVLSGLQHAHDHGVIHRDIKPANIIVSTAGNAKVIDFGLAKDAESQTILTMAGNVMGTPSYMSPEQARGEQAAASSDLYACGIILFQLLTGRKPFEGRGIVEILDKQLNAPLPQLRSINPAVSESLDRVVRKMTAKKPEQRYGSPNEAIEALLVALKGPAVSATVTAIAPPQREAAPPPPPPKPAAPPPRPATARAAAPAPARGGGATWVWVVISLVLAGVIVFLLLKK